MKYILDLAVVVIFLANIVSGVKKGFIYMIIIFAGLIAAFAAAGFLSEASAGYVYDNFVREKVIASALEKSREVIGTESYIPKSSDFAQGETEPQDNLYESIFRGAGLETEQDGYAEINEYLLTNEHLSDKINGVFIDSGTLFLDKTSGILPEEIISEGKEILRENELTPGEKFNALNSEESFAETLEILVIRNFAVRIIRYIIFAVVFAAVMILSGILGKATGILARLPVIKDLNGFLGGILGLLKGTVILFVIMLVCDVFISLTGDDAFINSGIISQTVAFKTVRDIVFLIAAALFTN